MMSKVYFPITNEERERAVKVAMARVDKPNPGVNGLLLSYEAALTAAEARVKELEERWSKVEDAHQVYQTALRNREHGDVAAHNLVQSINDLMLHAALRGK